MSLSIINELNFLPWSVKGKTNSTLSRLHSDGNQMDLKPIAAYLFLNPVVFICSSLYIYSQPHSPFFDRDGDSYFRNMF